MKNDKILIWIGMIVVAILFYRYSGFFVTYPNAIEDLGVITFDANNWDGYDLTMRVSKSSGYWGTGWSHYTWTTSDVRPPFSVKECYEKGFGWAYPQGFCLASGGLTKGHIKSKTATLTINENPYNYDSKLSIGSNSIAVGGIDVIGSGILDVEVVISYYCRLGDEKCVGTNVQKCELISQDFAPYQSVNLIAPWTAEVNRWVSKGEVLGKCGVVEPCTEDWTTGDWGECVNNIQTRTVTDLNECGTEINKPEETTDCSVQCIPNWECNAWSTCTNNIQTRTCVDSNDCGIVSGKPITTQSCGDVVCPADVKQCSDGSYVSRVAPSCEFASCPIQEESFLYKVLFDINGFEVIVLHLIIAGTLLFLLIISGGKRR